MVFIAERSNKEHYGPLTLNGFPLPFMHRNARSRYITSEEIFNVYQEDVLWPVTTAVEGPRR